MDRPTLLMVGSGEPMDAALRLALDRHGLFVEAVGTENLRRSVQLTAPDLILLLGDAAEQGGIAALSVLAGDASSAAVPVILLAPDARLESRMHAFRHGAMAVVPRSASPDAIARKISGLTKELSEHFEERTGEIGEATFDELVDLVKKELRSGILSVHAPNHKGGPMRVVLGAGRPVAQAVHEFVARLKPHVTAADAMYYQFHTSAGGPVELLDMEGGTAKVESLESLRILLVDDDPARADTLAQELRARGAMVFVTDNSGRGLERAVGLDPQVAILDAAGLEGPGFEVVRAIRKDLRLRWASILVAPWDEVWPRGQTMPDIDKLASRMEPLLVPERELAERAQQKGPFDVRLESTGPGRMLRILVASGATLHLTIRNPKAVVEVDLAEGLLVGAMAKASDGKTAEGTAAVAVLLSLGSARVHVERRANPAVANVMSPVDEALSVATSERARVAPSQPPLQASKGEPAKAPSTKPGPDLDSSELRWGGAPAATFVDLAEDDAPNEATQIKNLEGLARAGEVLLQTAATRPAAPPATPPELGSAAKPQATRPARADHPPRPAEPNAAKPAANPLSERKPAEKRRHRATLAMGSPLAPKPIAKPRPAPPSARSADEVITLDAAPAALVEASPPPLEAASRSPARSAPAEAKPAEPPRGPAEAEPPAPPLGPAEAEPPAPPLGPAEAKPPAPPLGPAEADPAAAPVEALPGEVPPAPRRGSPAPVPAAAPRGIAPSAAPTPRRSAGRGLAIASVVLASIVLAAVLGLIGYRYSGLRYPEVDRVLVMLGTSPRATPAPPEPEEPVAPREPAVPAAPSETALAEGEAAPAPAATEVQGEPGVEEAPEDTAPDPAVEAPAADEPAGGELAAGEPAGDEPAPEDPAAGEPPEGTRVDELLSTARRAGTSDLAERLYRRVLELEPREHHAMVGLAEIRMERNAPAEAAELLRGAIRRRPRRAAYRVLLGDALAAAGDNAGARRAWEEALELDPDDARARRRLGR